MDKVPSSETLRANVNDTKIIVLKVKYCRSAEAISSKGDLSGPREPGVNPKMENDVFEED